MSAHGGPFALGFPETIAQIVGQFLGRVHLRLGRLVTIKIADQTDADGNIVEVVTGDMASIDLFGPTAADFNFSIAGGIAIADHKVIREAVAHFSDIAVVAIEDAGVSLAGGTVVDDDVLPASPPDGCLVDGLADFGGQIAIAFEPSPSSLSGCRLKASLLRCS